MATGTTNTENKSRKRVIPLLREFLDGRNIPQLRWVEKERGIWRMPWKHHKTTRWGDPDAFMLRELAKRLYGYKGPDEPEKEKLKHWKELIRNALGSFKKDVKELKDRHDTGGVKPYKVYQFLVNEDRIVNSGRGQRLNDLQGGNAEICQPRLLEAASAYDNISIGRSSNSTGRSNFRNSQLNPQFEQTSNSSCVLLDDVQSNSQIQNSDYTRYCQNAVATLAFSCDRFQRTLPAVCSVNDSDASSDKFSGNLENIPLEQLFFDLHVNDGSTITPCRSRSPLSHGTVAVDEAHVSREDTAAAANKNNNVAAIEAWGTSTSGNNQVALTNHNDQTPAMFMNDGDFMSPGHNVLVNKTVSINTVDQFSASNPYIFSQLKNSAAHEMGPRCVGNSTEANSSVATSSISSNLNIASSILSQDKHALVSSDLNQEIYLDVNKSLASAPEASLVVVAYYSKRPVKCQTMKSQFRICFLRHEYAREDIKYCEDPKLYGPKCVDMFELPKIEESQCFTTQARNTKKILQNLNRGIIIDYKDGDVFATRYCKAVPLFCIPEVTGFQKMERHQEVKIFDFQSSSSWVDQNVKPCVRLIFSARDPNGRGTVNPLTVEIWHRDAHHIILGTAENTPSLEPDCSISDEYDFIVDTVHDLMQQPELDLYTCGPQPCFT